MKEHALIVYDKDGKTPVGEFTIFPGQEAGKRPISAPAPT